MLFAQLMSEEIHRRGRQRGRWTQRTLVNHLQSQDEIVRQRKRGRRLHAHPARHLGNEVVAIIGENAPGVVDSADADNDRLEPTVFGSGERPAETACDLVTQSVLFRHRRRLHRKEMSEHHTQEIAGRMDVGVGCARRPATAVKAAISNVAVTVYTVDRDAKLDVIGILDSSGMLRLRPSTNRCDPGWSCKKTSRQYPGNEQRYRDYTSPYILAHNSSTPTGNVTIREVLKCSDRRVNKWKESPPFPVRRKTNARS